jgi:O-antigen/teichoic acid export membrane protein
LNIIELVISKLGVNRAIRWTLLTQGIRLITGPATMFLMIRYLSAECQGYAYTFGSVLAISIFLEMGFSQNILQFASHEFASLSFRENGSLTGDSDAYSRLISLGRLSFKYYGVAAILFFIALMIGGNWFFSTSHDVGISWQGPWLLVSITSALGLFLNPCWSLLEGCNKIPEVEKFRFYSSLVGFIGLAIGLLSGLGLYAVCINSLVITLISLFFLASRWRHFIKMFLVPTSGPVISWRNEIWPFQWRIAVSWMCGYFIFSIITPMVFRLAGPKEAGQIGFTLQLTRLVASVASSWSTTRLPEFGMLVARRDWLKLAEIWRRSTTMNVIVASVGSVGMIIGMEAVMFFVPNIASRYGGGLVAFYFCVSMVAQSLINSLAYYLRAFKEEPFMGLSVANAILSFSLIALLTLKWQVNGAALAYMLSTLIMLPFAWRTFQIKGRAYREMHLGRCASKSPA